MKITRETIMKNYKCRYINRRHRGGFALVFVVVMMVILMLIGTALLTITYGMRLRAIKLKGQTVAMLAAEAGYEQGMFWMSQQSDILGSLQNPSSGSTGSLNFGNSSCTYAVQPYDYIGQKPVFEVISTGLCGRQKRTVDVFVIQDVSGWDMGMCKIPDGSSSTQGVYFGGNEVIDMKIHINNTPPASERDIYIDGSPQFLQQVEMGESRYYGGSDKYAGVMNLFQGGIIFDQPDTRITDKAAIDSKLNRFRDSTTQAYRFTPVAANIPHSINVGAVQLEFYVQNNIGMVRIRRNCTVIGCQRAASNTLDYMINPSNANAYVPYNTYAYHYVSSPAQPGEIITITDTYVTQTFAGKQSAPSGQIYVNGNVIIGGDGVGLLGTPTNQILQGKLTIVAEGNIWIADSIVVNGLHGTNGMPDANNPNALGLIARGVVKVIDPGISGYVQDGSNGYYGPATDTIQGGITYKYIPVANGSLNSNDRNLSNPTVVEAAITVGGGGWGAENVTNGYGYGGRKNVHEPQDDLIVRGTICEAIRGVVGMFNTDGYLKHYYLDRRLLEGVLPGNIWFGGKFIPAPAGWHDSSN
jgi:hypothetical protein